MTSPRSLSASGRSIFAFPNLAHLILIIAVSLGFVVSAHAQNPQPSIWTMYYGNDCYQYNSQSADGNGNAVLQYTTYDGGTAVLTWNTTINDFANAVFNPPSGGSVTYTYAGAPNPGGALTMTGSGTNALQSIGGASYDINGSLALAEGGYNLFTAFVYAAEAYTATQTWMDMLSVSHYVFQGSAAGTAQGQTFYGSFVSLQIATGGGLIANYVARDSVSYSLTADSTSGNDLSSIDGLATTTSGSTLNLPIPFSSFVYGGELFTPTYINWEELGPGFNDYWYEGANGDSADVINNGTTLRQFYINIASPDYYSVAYDDGANHGVPGAYYYDGITYGTENANSGNLLTALGGIQYIHQGNFVVPAPVQVVASPVYNFEYNGEVYSQSGGGTWNNGYGVYQFVGANGGTATVNVDPNTKAVVSWKIDSASGAATYAPGANGSYVLQNGSNGPSALNWVNNVAYTVSGGTSTPPPGISDNGNVSIQGNQFTLGTWTGDSSHGGMTMSFYDGGTDFETDVLLSSSRPSTDWLWEHPSTDGQSTLISMELDPSHKLQLYPLDQTPSASGVTPTIILDPNNVVRFDIPVRIKPQGDLQMGEFINEPTPTTAQ